VTTSLNLSLKLVHFFPLALKEILSLLISVFLFEHLNTVGLLLLEVFEFLSVVHGLLDSLVDSNEGFIVLHLFETGVWFDGCALDGAVQFLIQQMHLILVLTLQVVHFHQRFVFELLEFGLPRFVEVLKHLVTNGYVLLHLSLLDVLSEFILIDNNLGFEESDLAHQVLVQSVFVNLAALGCDQEHLFFDR